MIVNAPIRIVFAEPQELVRSSLSLALVSKGGYDVVAETDNLADTLLLTEKHQPDLVMLEVTMGTAGLATIKQIHQQWPHVRVMVLTSDNSAHTVLSALTSGATAYCLKTVSIEILCTVLKTVVQGAVWLDPQVAPIVLQALPKVTLLEAINDPQVDQLLKTNAGHVRPTEGLSVLLTEREWQVLAMIVDGKSNKEIAQLLSVSSHTAKAHVCHIIQKLNVDDRTQVAVKALKEGLVDGLFERQAHPTSA
jgi:DNA-binding NarL/FixJ family response regulator